MKPFKTNIELLQGLREGDEAVFAWIYQVHHNAVYANICKLVKNEADAEDMLQEVFTLLWKKRLDLTDEQNVAGWLFLTSHYKALESLKASLRVDVQFFPDMEIGTAGDDFEPDSEAAFAQKLTILHQAIEQLSPQKKSAFTLCHIEGKTYRQAAQEMGISEETVKDYIKSSLKFIRAQASASGYPTGAYMIGLLATAIPFTTA